MAKAKPKKKTAERVIGGPFLAAAFYCEGILEDTHGKLTIQNIIDSLHIVLSPFSPKDMPSDKAPLPFNIQIMLAFKSGDAPGKHRLKLEIESPSGRRDIIKDEDITLTDPPYGGINIKNNIAMSIVSNGGLYLVDVYLDDVIMTRIPLNLTVTRAEMPANVQMNNNA